MSTIHNIATAVPPFAYHQDYAAECMQRWVRGRAMQRMVRQVYRQSGIARRYSVLPDFQPDAAPLLFGEASDGALIEPTTGQRNACYQQTYPALVREAARGVFAATPWIAPGEVTHVITVSCTGFCNPGPDLLVIEACGLAPNVERYHLGFMGCYAAFPALRMADQFCRAHPGAVVLVVCVELCSLHLQIKPTPDALLANALFADGAAAVLIANRPLPPSRTGLDLDHFASRVIPDSADAMAWTIGDRGFDMTLSGYVPRILGLHAPTLLEEILASSPARSKDIAGWAIHPGGKAILNTLATQMGWSPQDPTLALAHRVLRDYGNMSSATILFVLRDLIHTPTVPPDALLGALAFGPGLTVEFARLRLVGTASASALQPVGACPPIPEPVYA